MKIRGAYSTDFYLIYNISKYVAQYVILTHLFLLCR